MTAIALNIFLSLLMKLLSERFISKGIILALKEIAKRTQNKWDDNLVKMVKDEIAPDMQLEHPEDWPIHEETKTIILPKNGFKGNLK